MSRATGVHGGLRLDAHVERSTATPIRRAAAPAEFVLPLDQHAGAAARPTVRPGERVLLGQSIAEPAGPIGAELHAPASGTITSIEPRPAPHRLGAPALSIVIANDRRDDRFERPRAASFETQSPDELLALLARGGIVGLGGAAFPMAVKLESARAHASLTLLLNGAECEPYISCDEMLMRERADDIVLGARILLHALNAPACIIALEDEPRPSEAALRQAIADAHDQRIALALVPNVYPAGGERQLIAAVFGREVPHDGLPADIGVLCQNVGTAAAAAHWIRDGLPLVSRIVTVTGDGVCDAGNFEVRIGAPINGLIAECGGYTERMQRLLMGGSMMGQPLPHDELPVIKATNCVIAASALDLQPRARELPCIRCGACADACPAILLPQQLHWFARIADLDALHAHGLMDCIECGCCDYVCPSQIPLAERFREAKPLLVQRALALGAATAARARFDERNARLERLAVEQRAALEHKRRVRTEAT